MVKRWIFVVAIALLVASPASGQAEWRWVPSLRIGYSSQMAIPRFADPSVLWVEAAPQVGVLLEVETPNRHIRFIGVLNHTVVSSLMVTDIVETHCGLNCAQFRTVLGKTGGWGMNTNLLGGARFSPPALSFLYVGGAAGLDWTVVGNPDDLDGVQPITRGNRLSPAWNFHLGSRFDLAGRGFELEVGANYYRTDNEGTFAPDRLRVKRSYISLGFRLNPLGW